MIKKLLFAFNLLVFFSSFGTAQTWSPLGDGVGPDPAYPDVMYNDTLTGKLYVGGDFKKAGGKLVYAIATWDGENWDSVGCGMARSNPLSDSDSLPQHWGTCGHMPAITRYKGFIYEGGGMCWAGKRNFNTQGIAKFDGKNWGYAGNALSTSKHDTINPPNGGGEVSNFLIDRDTLYGFGYFDTIGGKHIRCIGKYDGQNWYPVMNANFDIQSGLAQIGTSIFYKGQLYFGGNFGFGTTDFSKDDIARWDGKQLLGLGKGLSSSLTSVSALIIYKGELYVGGIFFKKFGDPGDCIAKWDGEKWSEVGGGVNSSVESFAILNDELYVGGHFTSAGGLPNTQSIAKWNGEKWSALPSTDSIELGGVIALAVYKGDLIVSKAYSINGKPCNAVAKYHPPAVNSIQSFGVSSINLSLFPNPSKESSTLVYDLGKTTEGTITISDLLGKEVQSFSVHGSSEIKLNIEKFESGIYFLTLKVPVSGDKTIKWVITQ